MRIIKPLTPEEQRQVEENESLIYYVARPYLHIPKVTYEDLIGRLYWRLCCAIQDFNVHRGFQLSSFVVKSLQGEVRNYFRDEIWLIKPPRILRERPLSKILNRTGGQLSEAELQGENPDTVRTCVLPVALDAGYRGDEEGYSAPDILVDDPRIEDQVVSRIGGRQILREVFAALTFEERVILALRMKAYPLWALQERFGISRAVAAQVWRELQGRVATMYLQALEGEPVEPSRGSYLLRRAVKARLAELTRGTRTSEHA